MTGFKALLALCLVCLSLTASAQPIAPVAPGTHAATGMSFPANVEDHARLIRSVDRGKADNQPELGFTWYYAVDKLLDGVVAVYVLNNGQAAIPAGADSPIVVWEFEEAITEMSDVCQCPRTQDRQGSCGVRGGCPHLPLHHFR